MSGTIDVSNAPNINERSVVWHQSSNICSETGNSDLVLAGAAIHIVGGSSGPVSAISNNTISNNTISKANVGISVNNSLTTLISNNTISNCTTDGLYILSTNSSNATNNAISNITGGDGIYLSSMVNGLLTGNNVSLSGGDGYDVYNSTGNQFISDIVRSSNGYDFYSNGGSLNKGSGFDIGPVIGFVAQTIRLSGTRALQQRFQQDTKAWGSSSTRHRTAAPRICC